MSADLPETDPLADLVSRSLGARVESVEAQVLPSDDGVERKRLRFRTEGGDRTAIFERSPRGATLEAQLLPFLARKSDRVPVVHARGLPPPRAALGPWVLLEDVLDAPVACDGDVADIVRAKLTIERAVSHDVPALRALGVTEDARPLPPELARVPRALVHGDLRCAVTRRIERGVVIVGWSHASFGCPVLDVAMVARDLAAQGRADEARRVCEAYARETAMPDTDALLALADRVVAG